VSVAASGEQEISSGQFEHGQFEQMTSKPVEEPAATGGEGQRVERQLPSIGHAVGAGEVPDVAEGSATGDPHGPPPTPMQTPPLPVVEAPPLTATALDTGGAATEALPAELDEL
jgi:hypothetical protein